MKFKTLQARIMLSILPLIIIALLSIVIFAFFYSKNLISQEISAKMYQQLSSVTNHLETKLVAHRKLPEVLARSIEFSPSQLSLDNYVSITKRILTSNQDTFGIGVFYEPYKYNNNVNYFSSYAYRDGDKISDTQDYNTKEYDYPHWDWYKVGQTTQSAFAYTDPYFDDIPKITMVTASVPFFDNEHKFLGVTTGDINLTSLQKLVNDTKVGNTGWAFMLDTKGTYLAEPDVKKVMKLKIDKDPNKLLAAFAKPMLTQDKGEGVFSDTKGSNHIYYQKVLETGWVLALVIPDKELLAPMKKLLITLIIASLISIGIIILVIVLFSKYITNHIKRTNAITSLIADGDLTQTMDVKSHDEFGQMAINFNAMTTLLKESMTLVSMHSLMVASTSEQLSASSEETSKATEQIADSIQQVASGSDNQVMIVDQARKAIVNISDQLISMAEGVQEVNESSMRTGETARRGDQAITEATKQMVIIQQNVHNSTVIVNSLNDKSKDIGQMISLITSLASQTNLLALNASIEAARAGEQGRGFAVVAVEVRKLAEQSAQVADKISREIKAIQMGIANAVESMSEGSHAVNEGAMMADHASIAFREIHLAIEDVFSRIAELSASSTQIRVGAKVMVDSVEEISLISTESVNNTHNIAAAAEQQLASMQEVTAASQTLSKMADELQGILQYFKI